MVVHKDYQAPTFENDIAILELEDPIQRQPHVVPICMPRWASHKDVDDLNLCPLPPISTSSSHAAISIFVGVIIVCLLIGITTRSSWTQWELSLDGDDLNMVGDQVNIKVEILINSYDLSVIADFVNYVQEVAFRISFTKSRCQLSTMTAAKTCSPLQVCNQ